MLQRRKATARSVEEKLRISELSAQGRSANEIAKNIGRTQPCVSKYLKSIKTEIAKREAVVLKDYDEGLLAVDSLLFTIAQDAKLDINKPSTQLLEVLRRWADDVFKRKRLIEGKSTSNVALLAKIQQLGLDKTRNRLKGDAKIASSDPVDP